jgi:putative addiction module component (TIGR02574 family)
MEEALALPAEERRRLGLALLESADEPESGLSDAWKREIGRRLEQLQSGNAETVPAAEVEARIRRSIERARQTHADD